MSHILVEDRISSVFPSSSLRLPAPFLAAPGSHEQFVSQGAQGVEELSVNNHGRPTSPRLQQAAPSKLKVE